MSKFFTVKEVIEALIHFPPDSFVLIESSDGEYGPRAVSEIHTHQGTKEPHGVDEPFGNDRLKGSPVIT